MLPDTERLRKAGLFQRVYTARRSVASDICVLYVLPRQPKSSPRMPLAAFVAGKKVHNKACKRNKAKRRFREAYRLLRTSIKAASNSAEAQNDDKLNLRQWYALVWVIQDKALGAEFKDIMSTVHSCLQRANQKFGSRRASPKAP